MDTKSPITRAVPVDAVALPILAAISFSHLLNDMIQSLMPAIYPILKQTYRLDFGQIGLITLTFQCTASLLQPAGRAITPTGSREPLFAGHRDGLHADRSAAALYRRPRPTGCSCWRPALVGMGSSVFHPESSRVARMASGGRHGFAQSFFQVGGNAGSAIGPLLAAFIVVPFGQRSIAWFSRGGAPGDGGAVSRRALVSGAHRCRSRSRPSLCRSRAGHSHPPQDR